MEMNPKNTEISFGNEGTTAPKHTVSVQYHLVPGLTTPSPLGIGDVTWSGKSWEFTAKNEIEGVEGDVIGTLSSMMRISAGDLIDVVRDRAQKKLNTPLN
jgi:hypothetical protein